MGQFRTTADIIDNALRNSGEVTNGNSPYETQALDFINRVHFTLVAGGTIALGKDTTVQIDEAWPWAKSRGPLIIELQPKYDSGTVTLTQGSEIGSFSSAPSSSLQGYHLKIEGRSDWMKIAQHTAGASAFELDAAYTDESGSGLNFIAAKLDYQLVSNYIIINDSNNKIQFQKAAGTTLTASLTNGSYTPSDLATHVATQITTAASGPTIAGSYSSITRKFSFTSDLAGPTIFRIVGDGDQSAQSAHRVLGFDDETTSSAATQTSVYIRGGISRLIEPFRVHKGSGEAIFSLDVERFHRDYPLKTTEEGTPDRFCVYCENQDGIYTVRFNKYPTEKTRVEIDNIAIPRDLKDNSSSIPLVPRKWIDVLEDAATFYIMLLKNDDRAQVYANLCQGKLQAMISQHRGSLSRSGEYFGQIIPRIEQTNVSRRRLFPQDPY